MFIPPIQQGRDANNNPITELNDKKFNQPFHVYDVSYDSQADQLDFNVGVGRAVFDGTVVEQNSETTFSFSGPSASTTYHGYLNSDGSYTLEQSASAISKGNSSLLFRLDTPSDLSNTGADDLTDLRNMLPANSNMQAKRIEVFTSDGTFTVPSGVSEVIVTVVAGGGGGGDNGAGTGNGGGAGGAYLNRRATVSPGSDLPVQVGGGGDGAAAGSGNDGNSGGDSSFSSITATGGQGGGQTSAGASGRPDGCSSDGVDTRGGDSPVGVGGDVSDDGTGFGAGGGGGPAGVSGGNGTDGIVIVQW